ncbi:MAG: LysM peptidoglycan-binding domain-containing protein [Gammaproteobacteria bacterium]
MGDTPIRRPNGTANPRGDESDDPLAESIIGRSAQRFEPESTAEDAEFAYYLGTNPRSGGHPAPARPAAPAPRNRHDPHNKDSRGFSEDEFEAAFRSLEKQTSSAPVREGSVVKKGPVFEEPPPQDNPRTFAQTFEEEMAGSPGTCGQEFETRADAFDFDTRFIAVIAVTALVFVAVIGALIYSWVGQQRVAAAATPSGQNSVAERVRNPSDVASPSSLLRPSIPAVQSEPGVSEPSAALEPAPPLPETVDTEADRVLHHAGTNAPPHAPPPVGTPPASTYTIQDGDTLIAIAAHFYGDASQWSVIARANPKADPRRLRVGQEIKLPRTRPSP